MSALQAIKARVAARVAELTAIAQDRYPDFPAPLVAYFDGRRAAGLASPSAHRVSFNTTLLRENVASMLTETVAHEVAHLVVAHAFKQARKRPRPHGREWQYVMRTLFGVEPARTHCYDMSNCNVRRQRRWIYRCDCREHAITTVLHKKIASGRSTYRCACCKGQLARGAGA